MRKVKSFPFLVLNILLGLLWLFCIGCIGGCSSANERWHPHASPPDTQIMEIIVYEGEYKKFAAVQDIRQFGNRIEGIAFQKGKDIPVYLSCFDFKVEVNETYKYPVWTDVKSKMYSWEFGYHRDKEGNRADYKRWQMVEKIHYSSIVTVPSMDWVKKF